MTELCGNDKQNSKWLSSAIMLFASWSYWSVAPESTLRIMGSEKYWCDNTPILCITSIYLTWGVYHATIRKKSGKKSFEGIEVNWILAFKIAVRIIILMHSTIY